MKKALSLILVISMLLLCSACSGGKPDDITEAHYEYGLKVLEITDKYLTGELSAAATSDELNDFTEENRYKLPSGGLYDDMIESYPVYIELRLETTAITEESITASLQGDELQDQLMSILELRNIVAGYLNEKELKESDIYNPY